jgi:P27 family predicted phage terminase small subunit
MKHLIPKHLTAATRAWVEDLLGSYRLEEHHVRLLVLAAEAWDRHVSACAQLAKDGLTIGGREGGLRPHPAVAIARDAAASFARLLQQLGLDDADQPARGPGRPGRPIGIGYEQLRKPWE